MPRHGMKDPIATLLSGLFIGVLIGLGEGVLNGLLLRQDWTEAMLALGRPPLSVGQIASLNGLCLVLGWAIAELFRASIPQRGAGAANAVRAGVVAWLLAYVLGLGWSYAMGIYSHKVYWLTIGWALVELPLAACGGAWLYRRMTGIPSRA